MLSIENTYNHIKTNRRTKLIPTEEGFPSIITEVYLIV